VTETPVLVLADSRIGAAALADIFALLRQRHQNARLILLTSPALAAHLAPLSVADTIWSEGHIRGFSRLLALLRRISWEGVGTIYDLEQSGFSRILWLSVWPRPHWRTASDL